MVTGLALLTGACGIPVALTAGSYAADGGLALTTNKTSTDHFISMVSKEDCSTWRIFRHQPMCKERDPNAPDPYNVNYDEPYRSQSEGGGVQYGPPLHAKSDAPATSWDAASYTPATPPQPAPSEPATAVAETTVVSEPPPAAVAPPQAPPAPPKKKKVAGRAKAKKPSQGQVASAR